MNEFLSIPTEVVSTASLRGGDCPLKTPQGQLLLLTFDIAQVC